MNDLERYINKRKQVSAEFADDFDKGYEEFKFGVLLKQARREAGLTQSEIAKRMTTQKSAISRIENHANDVKLSTLDSFAKALGRKLEVRIV